MQTVLHLSTCDTCRRILKNIEIPSEFKKQDIKKESVTEAQLKAMYKLTNSYEELFNKRAQLYRKRGLNKQELSESDYKDLLIEHYTFLKRPVVIDKDVIFVGNSKKNVAELEAHFAYKILSLKCLFSN